jgi:phospholipid/cholesterol/gamma-HCH transport system substrate-binding protein
MPIKEGIDRISPGWCTLGLVIAVIASVLLSVALFAGTFTTTVPVILTADRSGLVMESGAKVKMRGVQVGRVSGISGGQQPVSLKLEIFPDQVKYIPANVEAEIKATTAFGAKYVELIPPDNPVPQRLQADEVLRSRNVSTEVNTVFENLVQVLHQVDPTKLNATLSALAEAVRGMGPRIGEATSDANQMLLALNPRMDTARQDWRSLQGFSDAYAAAAQDIIATLDAASTTSQTITDHAASLDALLLSAIGFSHDGTDLVAAGHDNYIKTVNVLGPTADLLLKYQPEYTCLLVGSKWYLDHGGYAALGGNGKSSLLDAALLFGDDPYRYPDNLPIVAAKGGPGGKPSCGSLPDASTNFPVRQLVTNTGWGTGLDIRPNPGIGHPWWIDFFPVTRGIPQPPSIRGLGPPAIGPVPYPGAPPYGAPAAPAPASASAQPSEPGAQGGPDSGQAPPTAQPPAAPPAP